MRPSLGVDFLLGASIALSCLVDNAKAAGQQYKTGDQVELWVNKVGPYANPQEAYEYYTLPYCATNKHPIHKFNEPKPHSLGEILGGHSLRNSGHNIRFISNVVSSNHEECTTEVLTEEQAAAFSHAAEEDWFYQMFLDDLPVWGMVGEVLPEWEDADTQKEFEQKLRHGESDKEALENALSANHVVQGEGFTLHPYVYTERKLIVSVNGPHIIQVDLVSDPTSLKRPHSGTKLTFSLTVEWKETSDEFSVRFDRYLDHEFFKHQIHWFSIFNSFMMVLFLTGLVALILLRTLKRDYARYSRLDSIDMDQQQLDGNSDNQNSAGSDDDLDDDDNNNKKGLLMGGNNNTGLNEDSGWKQVHGDVFRAPAYLPIFAAGLGIGWQIIVLTGCVILFALLGPIHGDVYEERGEVMFAVLVFYCLSSIVSGYMSGSFFKRFYSTSSSSANKTNTSLTSGGQAWQGVLLLTVALFPTVVVSILFALDIISISYGTINSLPPLVIVKLFFLWTFVSVPLAVVGTLLGRHQFGGFKKGAEKFPCRVNSIPRPIPEDVPWYGEPKYLIPLAGLLPFGSIFIELYYVLTALWNYKVYHVYGFLFGMFGILAVVVSMTSIISTYFCLNAENYQWQWTSFFSGASTAMYVFLYGIYYFMMKTSMHGFFQTMHYFGYMLLISITMGMSCGTLGYFSSEKFVKTIFQNLKVD